MVSATRMAKVKHVLETMTENDLIQVVQHAAQLRNARNCKLLQLPGELRNRIYRLSITPETVETHHKTKTAPALLKVSRQISYEFASIYYSEETMHVELYNPKTRAWEAVEDGDLTRTMFIPTMTNDSVMCVRQGREDAVMQTKESIERTGMTRRNIIQMKKLLYSRTQSCTRIGIVSWSNGEFTSTAVCRVHPEPVQDEYEGVPPEDEDIKQYVRPSACASSLNIYDVKFNSSIAVIIIPREAW